MAVRRSPANDQRPGNDDSKGRDQAGSSRRKALDLLARREHSTAELRDKLTAREFDPEEIETTLADLARDGLLSDERFVEAFVAAHVRRGQGPVRIRADLQRKGVAAGLIACRLTPDSHDWGELARSVRIKRFGRSQPRDFRERAKQSRFLEFRGFTMDHIRAALGAADDAHE